MLPGSVCLFITLYHEQHTHSILFYIQQWHDLLWSAILISDSPASNEKGTAETEDAKMGNKND